MKAIQLHGFEGPGSARLVDIDRPKPGANEILIEVKASGINYADLRLLESSESWVRASRM